MKDNTMVGQTIQATSHNVGSSNTMQDDVQTHDTEMVLADGEATTVPPGTIAELSTDYKEQYAKNGRESTKHQMI